LEGAGGCCWPAAYADIPATMPPAIEMQTMNNTSRASGDLSDVPEIINFILTSVPSGSVMNQPIFPGILYGFSLYSISSQVQEKESSAQRPVHDCQPSISSAQQTGKIFL